MLDPDRVVRIRTYLEQHRDTYDRDALRQQLLADGHDPESIDLAMAQVYGLQVAPQALPLGQRGTTFNTTQFALIIIGTIVLNFLLSCGAFTGAVNTSADGIALAALIGLGIGLPLLLEGVAAWVLRQRNHAISRGLMWGAITTLVMIILAALLLGVCIALLSGLSG